MASKIEDAKLHEQRLWKQYITTWTEEDRQAWAQAREELRQIISKEWRRFTTSG